MLALALIVNMWFDGGMTKKQKAKIWRDARVQNYANTRSSMSLAEMLVGLEDDGKYEPEFQIDEEWPSGVAKLKTW